VDLIETYDDLAALVPGSAESALNVREIEEEQRQLRFDPVTAEVAADLLLDNHCRANEQCCIQCIIQQFL
jgi:hypothetical protein